MGAEWAESLPTDEALVGPIPYAGSDIESEHGYFVLFVATDDDLQSKADRLTQFLWSEVSGKLPASYGNRGLHGHAYHSTPAERETRRGNFEHVYKVFVHRDAPFEPPHAQTDTPSDEPGGEPLSLKMGGGTMWGLSSLTSNIANTPLVFRDGRIELRDG